MPRICSIEFRIMTGKIHRHTELFYIFFTDLPKCIQWFTNNGCTTIKLSAKEIQPSAASKDGDTVWDREKYIFLNDAAPRFNGKYVDHYFAISVYTIIGALRARMGVGLYISFTSLHYTGCIKNKT